MSSKSLVTAIKVLLFVLIIGTPLFYLRESVYPYILSKTAFFQSVVELIFFVWLALAMRDARYRPKRTPALLGLSVFLAVLALTALTGIDPWRSFWSTQERALGVVALLHFAALAVVLSSLRNEIPWRAVWYVSLGTAAVVDVLAYLQLQIPNFLLIEKVGDRPGATFGNPTFLAGYLLLHTFVAAYFLVSRGRLSPQKRVLEIVFLLFAFSLNLYTLFLTQTRGDILGLGVGLLALLALFVWAPPLSQIRVFASRRFWAALLGLLVLGGVMFWTTRFNALWDKVPGVGRFRTASLSAEALQPRLIALRAGWLGFLERPLMGWGWDNFNVVFNKHYDPRALEASYQETRFDKPHNFLLEYMVAGGALLALAYVAFFGLFLLEALRLNDRFLGQSVVAALLAYVVRSLFVFDTLGPLLVFYLMLGWVDATYAQEHPVLHERVLSEAPRKRGIVAYAWFTAGVVVVYSLNILTVQAAYNQYEGFQNFVNRRVALAIGSFKEAIRTWSPYRWNLERDYATAVAEAYFNNPGLVLPEEARLAVQAMEEATREHPEDAYGHYALIDLYNQVSDVDPETYLQAAEREAQIALQLSPDRQEVYFSLAKTKTLEGDYQAALQLLRYALHLDDKVPDAHFYYGLLLFANHDPAQGYLEIKQAIALGRQWKNNNEPRVVAGYFADAGHLDEAIQLYKTALSLNPNDLEATIKLGVAYFFRGERDLAKQYLREAAHQFDFKKSSSYGEFKPILDALGVE